MRLINADALLEELGKLSSCRPGCGEILADVGALVSHAHVIEGKELAALVDDTDSDWLLEQEY